MRGHASRTIGAVILFTACQGIGPPSSPRQERQSQAGGAAPRTGPPPATAAGHTDIDRALPIEIATPLAPDPLSDPRERHLKNVRQLTHGEFIASPHFTPDGRAVLVISRSGGLLSLRQVPLTGESSSVPMKLAFPSQTLWGFSDGQGGPCAISAPSHCATQPWPEPPGLLPCLGLSLLPTSAQVTCPAQPANALPCAEGPSGQLACPLTAKGRAQIALSAGARVRQLGTKEGISWDPIFSRDGGKLAFVTQLEATSRTWVVTLSGADAAPKPAGPEAARTLDPVFSPTGEQLLFASTFDDAAGQDLDVLAVTLGSGALERITFAPGADRFPAFSPDGQTFAWVSERNADPGSADLFVATWVE